MSKRILIADDDHSVRESLKKILEDAGYDVVCASDGDDAERKFTSESVDLLLLDLDMPKQNGWNVFGMINSQNPLLPVVIITGLENQSDRELVPGVSALLEKPLDVVELLKTVERLLAEPMETRLKKVTGHLQASHPALYS